MGNAVYLQIADDLLKKIEGWGLPVGRSIPTIRVLREQYRTSHVTFLRAFKELAGKRIIQMKDRVWKGRNILLTEDRSMESCLRALRNGNFYGAILGNGFAFDFISPGPFSLPGRGGAVGAIQPAVLG